VLSAAKSEPAPGSLKSWHQQGGAHPALLLLGGPVRDERRQRPGSDGEVRTGHRCGSQLLVDHELLERGGAPAPWRRPVRHDEARLGQRAALVASRGAHRADPRHHGADLVPEHIGLRRQIGGQVAARAPDGERRHLVLERSDIPSGDQLQVGHGPLEVEVRIVLPGEADAAEYLDALLGAVRGRLERDGARDARAEIVVRGAAVLAPGRRRVPGHRGALLDRDQHVGERMLDGLELADGPAELDPHLGVLRRRLETPAGDPRALGRDQHLGQTAYFGVGDEERSGRRDQGRAVDLERPDGPGGVEGRQCVD
jgi:hypothetical protein